MKNPYWHELSSTGGSCAKSCPACLWAEHFEATGDSRRSPITASSSYERRRANCEVYLQDYAAGQQTAYKFHIPTQWVCSEIAEIREDVVAKHRIPAAELPPCLSEVLSRLA